MSALYASKAVLTVNEDGAADLFMSGFGQEKEVIAMDMTLRDHFAGKAMQGMTSNDIGWHGQPDHLAGCAYAIADAMLRARAAK